MVVPVSKPSLTDVESRAVADVMASGQLTYGPRCREFERLFAARLGVQYATATTSGTTALHLALAALGVGPGDEILVPDITFVATANAVTYCGATPVLVDVDRRTWTIDLDDADRRVTRNTKAIIPVHLYGVPCDMVSVWRFATDYKLAVIEDAAEGLGGYTAAPRYPLGTVGHVGVFSFYGNKIITTGEGGMVVTNSPAQAQRHRFLRGQGLDTRHGAHRYSHLEVGFNYRMTDLQAALGIAQLSRLEDLLAKRHAIMDHYRDCLYPHALSPCGAMHSRHVAPWLYTFAVPRRPGVSRDGLAKTLSDAGVETRPVFMPLHRLPMYRRSDEEFSVASEIGDVGLSLPTYPDLTLNDQKLVCDLVVSTISDK